MIGIRFHGNSPNVGDITCIYKNGSRNEDSIDYDDNT